MRLKELSVELRDRILLRHSSGEGYQNISAALKVPKNTVASIIFKRKMFATTDTLLRSGRPAKLSNWGEGPWSWRWPRTRWSLWQSSRVPLWGRQKLPEGQPSLQHSTNQAFMAEWSDGSLLWGCFSAAGTGRLVRIEGKMNGAKYRESLDENLLQRAKVHLPTGQRH